MGLLMMWRVVRHRRAPNAAEKDSSDSRCPLFCVIPTVLFFVKGHAFATDYVWEVKFSPFHLKGDPQYLHAKLQIKARKIDNMLHKYRRTTCSTVKTDMFFLRRYLEGIGSATGVSRTTTRRGRSRAAWLATARSTTTS